VLEGSALAKVACKLTMNLVTFQTYGSRALRTSTGEKRLKRHCSDVQLDSWLILSNENEPQEYSILIIVCYRCIAQVITVMF